MRAGPLALLLALISLAPLVPAPAPPPPALDCNPACNVLVASGAGFPALAVAPGDPQELLAAVEAPLPGGPACGARNAWVGVVSSLDGGRTWSPLRFVYSTGLTLPVLGPLPQMTDLYACVTAPTVGIDASGRGHVAALGLQHPGPQGLQPNGVWAAQTVDRGQSWGNIETLALGVPGAIDFDPPSMAVDPGANALGYLGVATNGQVTIAHSPDSNAWSPPVPFMNLNNLLGAGLPLLAGRFVQPALSPDTVYVNWLDGGRVYEAHSLDFGTTPEGVVHAGTVQPIIAPNSPYPVPTVPAFAVDRGFGPGRGCFFAAWQNQSFGDPDIVARRSCDLGHTFLPLVRVNDDAGTNVQFFPALAVGPDAVAHAAWYDRRDDPGNYLVGVYYAISRDNGATWSANLKVGDASFDPALSTGPDGSPNLGTRLALVVGSDNVAHVAWTDTRSGAQAVYAARVTH
jgi:hypothetical protein